jgi:hypothetical protein
VPGVSLNNPVADIARALRTRFPPILATIHLTIRAPGHTFGRALHGRAPVTRDDRELECQNQSLEPRVPELANYGSAPEL